MTDTGEPINAPMNSKSSSSSAPLSYAADIQPILSTCESCHGSSASGGFELTYDNLYMESSVCMPYIVPGDPCTSHLWHKITGSHSSIGDTGAMMPLYQPPLPEADLIIIYDWIMQGTAP